MDAATARRLVAIHAAACGRGDRTYTDPGTGLTVLTEVAHLGRGSCCGSACRHCPWDWENVDEDRFEGVEKARAARRIRRQQDGL